MIVPNVLVAGAFGQGNPGDESVLEAFVQGLDGCQVAATSAEGPVSRLSPPCRRIPARDPRAVAAAALEADLVVATATVFKTLHPSSGRHPLALLANTLALTAGARAAGRPVTMTAVGAGPLPTRTARALARSIAAVSGPVEVRDEESLSILRSAGVRRPVRVAADVTWSLMTGPHAHATDGAGPPRAPDRRNVVVALSHLAECEGLAPSLRGALRDLHRAGFTVAVQPWQLPRDGRMAEAVVTDLGIPVDVLEPPLHVPGAARTFRGASLVVGLRFHSLVAAATAGVPFVAVAHEPKLVALARRLDQVSVPPAAGAAEMSAACLEAIAGPPPAPSAIRREIALAEQAVARVRALAFERARSKGRRFSPAPATPA